MKIMGNGREDYNEERLQNEMRKSSIIGMLEAKILPLKEYPFQTGACQLQQFCGNTPLK